jgi:hypothetical protein
VSHHLSNVLPWNDPGERREGHEGKKVGEEDVGGPALAEVAAGASSVAGGDCGGWGVSRASAVNGAIPPQSF